MALKSFKILTTGTRRGFGKFIAEKLNTVGSLISLKRIRVGSFSINDSIRMETLESEWKSLGN